MAHLDRLTALLAGYYALPIHTDPALKAMLQAMQLWQKQRMQALHSDLFTQQDNQALATYFLDRLYGAADFDSLAGQCQKMLLKIERVQRLVPNAAMNTAVNGVALAMQAIVLDLAMAQALVADFGVLAESDIDQHMPIILAKLQQTPAREAYLVDLQRYGDSLDKYIRSYVIYTAFKLAKGKAEQKGFAHLYGFLEQGFAAMQQTKSTAAFINTFAAAEVAYYQQLNL